MKLYAADLKWYGRTLDNDGIRYFDYSSSAFEFCFIGKKASCILKSDPENGDNTNLGVVAVYVSELNSPDEYKGNSYWEHLAENPVKKIILDKKENNCILYESDTEKTVVIKVIKISEAAFGYAGLKEVEIDGKQILPKVKASDKAAAKNGTADNSTGNAHSKNAPKIEIIGDSITCGYGIEGVWEKDTFTTSQERADKSYAFLTARALNAEFQCVSWSGIGIISKYVDASVNLPDNQIVMPLLWPYTDRNLSRKLGIEPEIWNSERFSPDIVIVHLGTNDASFTRKIEERVSAYICGLRQFFEAIHRRSPNAKICACLGVMGQDLCDPAQKALEEFSMDFPSVPVKFVKFPVQDEKDGIAADWHPSAKTHEKIAGILTEELKKWN